MKKFREIFSAIILLPILFKNGFSQVNFRVVGESIITEASLSSLSGDESQEITQDVKTGVTESVTVVEDTANQTEGSNATSWGEGQGQPLPDVPKPNSATYPWLASIQLNNKHLCTGTLIDNSHILTTAYCLFQLSPQELAEIEIRIGFEVTPLRARRHFELSKGPFATEKVKRSIRHLRFSPTTGYNDIALLELLVPLGSDKGVHPVELVEVNDLSMDTMFHHIIGWRDGLDLNGQGAEYFRSQLSQGVSLDNCRKGYIDILDPQGISPGMMCSGGDVEATSCRWKFGTPLLVSGGSNSTDDVTSKRAVDLRQAGIFSWGSEALLPECRFGQERPTPLVFTRITSYSEWIQKNLKQNWNFV